MSDHPNEAVFLSYASQDMAAAQRIAEALRSAGVEVWFDQNELVGGDAWDAKIKAQVKECTLFMPVISAATQARTEGYFRLEWRIADQRTYLMAKGRPFLVPVVIDDTRESEALVPESFFEVQWTRLPAGATPRTFADHVKALTKAKGALATAPLAGAPSVAPRRRRANRAIPFLIGGLGLVVAGFAFAALRRKAGPEAKPAMPPAEAPAAPAVAPKAVSEARALANRAFAMSVDKYDSRLDDYTAADGLIKHALELDHDDGEIWAISADINVMFFNRGFDYNRERLNAAHQQAERAIRLAPDSAEANYVEAFLATRYGPKDKNDGAERMLHVLTLNPNHARALLSAGSWMYQAGRDAEGDALYQRVSQQPKWAPLVEYYWFLHDFNTGQFPQAEQYLRKSIALAPSVNSEGCLLMLHLTWKGDLQEAQRDLAAIPSEMLNEARVVLFAAKLALARRRPDEALTTLDRLPDDFIHDSWFIGPKDELVGLAHQVAGRPEAARIAWESAVAVVDARLKTAPNDVDLHLARGVSLGWLGRENEALAEAKTVDELNRHQRSEWDRSELKIYAALGRADLAMPMIKALCLDPSTPVNQRHKGAWQLTRTLLRLDPIWDKLRDEPEFKALIAEEPKKNAG